MKVSALLNNNDLTNRNGFVMSFPVLIFLFIIFYSPCLFANYTPTFSSNSCNGFYPPQIQYCNNYSDGTIPGNATIKAMCLSTNLNPISMTCWASGSYSCPSGGTLTVIDSAKNIRSCVVTLPACTDTGPSSCAVHYSLITQSGQTNPSSCIGTFSIRSCVEDVHPSCTSPHTHFDQDSWSCLPDSHEACTIPHTHWDDSVWSCIPDTHGSCITPHTHWDDSDWSCIPDSHESCTVQNTHWDNQTWACVDDTHPDCTEAHTHWDDVAWSCIYDTPPDCSLTPHTHLDNWQCVYNTPPNCNTLMHFDYESWACVPNLTRPQDCAPGFVPDPRGGAGCVPSSGSSCIANGMMSCPDGPSGKPKCYDGFMPDPSGGPGCVASGGSGCITTEATGCSTVAPPSPPGMGGGGGSGGGGSGGGGGGGTPSPGIPYCANKGPSSCPNHYHIANDHVMYDSQCIGEYDISRCEQDIPPPCSDGHFDYASWSCVSGSQCSEGPTSCLEHYHLDVYNVSNSDCPEYEIRRCIQDKPNNDSCPSDDSKPSRKHFDYDKWECVPDVPPVCALHFHFNYDRAIWKCEMDTKPVCSNTEHFNNLTWTCEPNIKSPQNDKCPVCYSKVDGVCTFNKYVCPDVVVNPPISGTGPTTGSPTAPGTGDKPGPGKGGDSGSGTNPAPDKPGGASPLPGGGGGGTSPGPSQGTCPDCAKEVTLQETNRLIGNGNSTGGFGGKPYNHKNPLIDVDSLIEDQKTALSSRISDIKAQANTMFSISSVSGTIPCKTLPLWGEEYPFCLDNYQTELMLFRQLAVASAWLLSLFIILDK